MSLSERDAGFRFQIALKGDCAALICELDHQVDAPWRVLRRMNTGTSVVDGDSFHDVGRDAGVVLRRASWVLRT